MQLALLLVQWPFVIKVMAGAECVQPFQNSASGTVVTSLKREGKDCLKEASFFYPCSLSLCWIHSLALILLCRGKSAWQGAKKSHKPTLCRESSSLNHKSVFFWQSLYVNIQYVCTKCYTGTATAHMFHTACKHPQRQFTCLCMHTQARNTTVERICWNDTALISISLPLVPLLFALGIAVGTTRHHGHKQREWLSERGGGEEKKYRREMFEMHASTVTGDDFANCERATACNAHRD